jgi:hypothetical protein
MKAEIRELKSKYKVLADQAGVHGFALFTSGKGTTNPASAGASRGKPFSGGMLVTGN